MLEHRPHSANGLLSVVRSILGYVVKVLDDSF
jgi:hypothetical protein